MSDLEEKKPFKAFIRVVKELHDPNNSYAAFGGVNIVHEPYLLAKDKNEVKQYLLEQYPQFFNDNKIYERQTKDQAQFFYVLIYPLYEWEIEQIKEGEWVCMGCGQVHDNAYVSKPMIRNRLGEDYKFCRSEDDYCYKKFNSEYALKNDLPDDQNYVGFDSPTYIYKVTEKQSGKCYIGKTKNQPFFRWWNHLKHSLSPFGVYLRQTKLEDWTFEVLETIPSDVDNAGVLKIESKYILEYNSIENGFNTLISSKEAVHDANQFSLL